MAANLAALSSTRPPPQAGAADAKAPPSRASPSSLQPAKLCLSVPRQKSSLRPIHHQSNKGRFNESNLATWRARGGAV